MRYFLLALTILMVGCSQETAPEKGDGQPIDYKAWTLQLLDEREALCQRLDSLWQIYHADSLRSASPETVYVVDTVVKWQFIWSDFDAIGGYRQFVDSVYAPYISCLYPTEYEVCKVRGHILEIVKFGFADALMIGGATVWLSNSIYQCSMCGRYYKIQTPSDTVETTKPVDSKQRQSK